MEPTHKEKMDYLKKHDPITYYELTTDPTGAGDASIINWPGVAVLIIVILASIYFL